MNSRKNTAFTVELLGLFILLTAVITIVTGVLVMTRAHSLHARQLTEAVILAQNAAEVSSAAADDNSLSDMLSSMDNGGGRKSFSLTDGEGNKVLAVYASMKGAEGDKSDGLYLITVKREYPGGTHEERADGGAYARDTVKVYAPEASAAGAGDSAASAASGEPLYSLVNGTWFDSGSYAEGGQP